MGSFEIFSFFKDKLPNFTGNPLFLRNFVIFLNKYGTFNFIKNVLLQNVIII